MDLHMRAIFSLPPILKGTEDQFWVDVGKEYFTSDLNKLLCFCPAAIYKAAHFAWGFPVCVPRIGTEWKVKSIRFDLDVSTITLYIL